MPQLSFGAFATLSDPTLSYSLTVTPAGSPPMTVAVASAAASAVVPNVPAGSGVISLIIVDAKGDELSAPATEPYTVLAAPAIPAFQIIPDAAPAVPPTVPPVAGP